PVIGGLPGALDLDALVVADVAAGRADPDARHDLRVALHELAAPHPPQRREVVAHVAALRPRIRLDRLLPGPLLHDVLRAREVRDQVARDRPHRAAARVVEVEVREDDVVDVLHLDLELGEPVLEVPLAADVGESEEPRSVPLAWARVASERPPSPP